MKYIVLIFVFAVGLMAGVLKSPILSVDEEKGIATIKIDKVDVGMSGFIVHSLSKEHTVILKNVAVRDYDEDTQIANLEMSPYDALSNNALPSGNWRVQSGDMAILAFGYTRGILIAPSDEIYHRITRSVKHIQWVHPDLFATILSFDGHPTPLREDFTEFSIDTSVGLVFLYIDESVFTIDSKSFKILNILDVDFKLDSTQLPFYTRVSEIDASWWGEGSGELESYEPYYYKLLREANPNNKELKERINNFNTKALK